MGHHAYLIEAGEEAGLKEALGFVERELGLAVRGNPDVIVLRYGLLSVEDARRVGELAGNAAFSGSERAIIVAASRVYHEAQNALLKLFEEPPQGVHLFLVVPAVGGLLPTLRSRVQMFAPAKTAREESEIVETFLKGSADKRSALVKKLTAGTDEDTRRENRDEAIALVNGVERTAYEAFRKKRVGAAGALLADLSQLRGYLYDRSAPVKLILEHLALITPRNLL